MADEEVVEEQDEIPMYETEPDPTLRPQPKEVSKKEAKESDLEVEALVGHGGGAAAAQPYVGPQTMHTKELPKNLSAVDLAKIPPGKVTGSTVNDWTQSPNAAWALSMLPDLTPAYRQANAV